MPQARLKNLPVFRGVEGEGLNRLEACLEEKIFGPNQVVFRRADPSDGLYIVLQGRVVLRSEVPGCPMERVREVLPGQLFGEMEDIEDGRRLLSARTVGDTVLTRIPQERVRELLADPGMERLLRSLVVRRRASFRRAQSSRLEPRIWVDRDVSVALEDEGENGEKLRLRLENLSWGGACFGGAPNDWLVARPLQLSVTADGRPPLLRASGAVRWRQGASVGLAFDGVGPALRRRVARALRELAPGSD